jgi:transposase
MDAWRREAEEPHHVHLCWRAPVHQGVGIDKREKLPLAVKAGRGASAARFIVVLASKGAAMNIRYRVDLSEAEHTQLAALLNGGNHAVRKIKRAQILLAADAGGSDVSVGVSTVYRTRRRFVEGNLEAALSEEARPGAERKLSGKETALLVATACSKPPAGRKRWTLDLLAGEVVRLTEHDSLSRETVRRRLGEDDLKPWRRKMWCIPKVDGTYVARMEDVLDLYAALAQT